jgi:hypothetical protein
MRTVKSGGMTVVFHGSGIRFLRLSYKTDRVNSNGTGHFTSRYFYVPD